jgi:protein-L-isoaspartate(D-aspartate) O-methyltransferase
MPQVLSDRFRLPYADQIMRLADIRDPRLKQAFAAVPREDFLPPPPWTVISAGVATRTHELADIYGNVLVAIDRARGINNGEPSLHAAWLGAVKPGPGETVVHIGAGTGYYTAILALLVAPGGHVEAYEYEPDLAASAAERLKPYRHATVHATSAFGQALPDSDVIYVNAGAIAPDPEWLRALRPGGRLIFPWQPHGGWGPAVLVTRTEAGFSASHLMTVGFIPCSGENANKASRHRPSEADIAATRSIWLTVDREPDETATAIYDAVWFSSEPVA